MSSRLPVAVIGGGSAGISAVAALASARRSVLWYDAPQASSQQPFAVGELQNYRAVPANTKVDKLVKGIFGNAVLAPWIAGSEDATLALAQLSAGGEAFPALEPHDPSPDGWVGLEPCRNLFARISDALAASEHVTCVRSRVDSVDHRSSGGGRWTVRAAAADGAIQEVQAAALVLATGGTPRAVAVPAHPAREIPVMTALDPSLLTAALSMPAAEATVGILGNSHTALVILDVCRSLGVKQVNLIARRPIRHAEWVPDVADYRYTMSGLKGRGSLVGRLFVDGTVVSSGNDEPNGSTTGKRRKVGEAEWAGSAAELIYSSEEELAGCLAGCTHCTSQALRCCAGDFLVDFNPLLLFFSGAGGRVCRCEATDADG